MTKRLNDYGVVLSVYLSRHFTELSINFGKCGAHWCPSDQAVVLGISFMSFAFNRRLLILFGKTTKKQDEHKGV